MLAATEELTVSAALNRDALVQMIENVDENHTAAHKRLRDDIQRLELEIDRGLSSLREMHHANKAQIDAVDTRPVDATKLMLTPRVVGAIVVTFLAGAAFIWGINSGLRSDVRDILTRMEAQKTAVEATTKLQEVQANAVKTAIDDMKRRQELQQYEIQGLKEAIITGKTRN